MMMIMTLTDDDSDEDEDIRKATEASRAAKLKTTNTHTSEKHKTLLFKLRGRWIEPKGDVAGILPSDLDLDAFVARKHSQVVKRADQLIVVRVLDVIAHLIREAQ